MTDLAVGSGGLLATRIELPFVGLRATGTLLRVLHKSNVPTLVKGAYTYDRRAN